MRALLVGESWQQVIIHQKGFDQFQTCSYEEGAAEFERAIIAEGIELDWMRAHDVPERFPYQVEDVSSYDVIVLSDIGANSFLLAPKVMDASQRTPNRLAMLADWTERGGGLVMVGGYLSFTGIDARARFGESPLAEALPVTMLSQDDRVEVPEGIVPQVGLPGHEIVQGVTGEWPHVLGYNRVRAKQGADVVAAFGDDPGIVAAEFGKGRTVAFLSDLAPHWAPPEFVQWEHYGALWGNILRWTARASAAA